MSMDVSRIGSRAIRWSTLLLALVLCVSALAGEKPTLELCAELVRDRPEELESYMCYWFVSRAGDPAGAGQALESHLAIDPANHRARLYLAAVEADLGHRRAEALYREAADGFASWGEPTGEVYARLSLYELLRSAGRENEANEELRRAADVAEIAEDPILSARVWSFQAAAARRRGDHGEALRLLRQAERVAFPDGPVDLRSGILYQMGYAFWAQGLIERALEAYTRQAGLMARAGDPFEEATARSNVAILSIGLFNRGRMKLDDTLDNLRQAAELASRVGNRTAEARARLELGSIDRSERGLEELRRALAIFRSIGDRHGARMTIRRLAYALLQLAPERRSEANRLMEEAIEDARSTGNPEETALGLIGRADMLQDAGDREAWIDASQRAIAAVERIRDLQPDGTVGARLFSRWSFFYYAFSGQLLRGLSVSPDPQGDLDLAFRTTERMRSRVLIDELDTAGAHPTPATGPDGERRAELLESIARIQIRLTDVRLPEFQRVADLDELERLEVEEQLLRDAIAREDPGFAALRSPIIPSIDQVRERLAPDQAVLSFQLSRGRQGSPNGGGRGGSWVITVTRDEARAFALPEANGLRERVGVFLGLCRRRDGSDTDAAALLYDDLLAEAMQAIGPSVRKLIVVPDDCLHRLPFAALRSGIAGDPLCVTHEIAQVPSIALWMKWRTGDEDGSAPVAGPAVLALADPDLGGSFADDRLRSAAPWVKGLQLGSLPRARAEARSLVRALGNESRMVSGPEANERFIKEIDLAGYRILHFATHAVVDYEHPERSAVVLAPGNENQDGFLQIREIAELELNGSLVILSACRSASGTVLRGEGSLGLARAFFRAGARAVIGNLWTLRDDEAEPLVGELGRQLAEGSGLAEALAEAQATRIAASAPTEAWAGLVLLGDGDFVPDPEGRNSLGVYPGWLPSVSGAALLLIVAIVVYHRYRSSVSG
jgi:CHAT domain-containing protein